MRKFIKLTTPEGALLVEVEAIEWILDVKGYANFGAKVKTRSGTELWVEQSAEAIGAAMERASKS